MRDVLDEVQRELVATRALHGCPDVKLCVFSLDRLSSTYGDDGQPSGPPGSPYFLNLSSVFSAFVDLSTVVQHFYSKTVSQGFQANITETANLLLTPEDQGDPSPNNDSKRALEVQSSIIRRLRKEGVFFTNAFCTHVAAPGGAAEESKDSEEPQLIHINGAEVSKYALRLRGLPWQVTKLDIIKFMEPFFSTCKEEDVFFVTSQDNRPSGQAVVELPSAEKVEECSQGLHGQFIQNRWVEVYPLTQKEVYDLLYPKPRMKRAGERVPIRIRGIPYDCNEGQIQEFFEGEGIRISIQDIIIGYFPDGRMTGEAWISLPEGLETLEAQQKLHRKTIGRRYIEIFNCSHREYQNVLRGQLPNSSYSGAGGRYNPYSGESRGGADERRALPESSSDSRCCIKLRGLPYGAHEGNICQFFDGFSMRTILPSTVPVDGRPSGIAYVEFVSEHESMRALHARQGALMDTRYIELFPVSKEEMRLAAQGVDPRDIRQRLRR